ncbi:MAG: hypothetical protein C4617_05070 [Candidatus Liberibacter europaeus]|uniref:Bro-N domain-containing protein n=1 Tax=Candidatus Liberibacter europaeus TaxID=744859 RepID=A0A2T4VWI7_9HYPH|nr:hypothetical protein [Candidatus Liberibacter europaeus]PTL86139.1 MAG: hypothetical protein C4617_05070 [Candidatus Liberibacter europaeus]
MEIKRRERKPPKGWVKSKVRTTMFKGELWFVARDVEMILDGKIVSNLVRDYCEGDRFYQDFFDDNVGWRRMRIINRAELYRLIARCKTPKAKEFSDYLFRVVLPTHLKRFPLPFETIEGNPVKQFSYPFPFKKVMRRDPIMKNEYHRKPKHETSALQTT